MFEGNRFKWKKNNKNNSEESRIPVSKIISTENELKKTERDRQRKTLMTTCHENNNYQSTYKRHIKHVI